MVSLSNHEPPLVLRQAQGERPVPATPLAAADDAGGARAAWPPARRGQERVSSLLTASRLRRYDEGVGTFRVAIEIGDLQGQRWEPTPLKGSV
jgi:hypothetical protein